MTMCAIQGCPNPAVREVVFEQWRGRPRKKLGEIRAWYCTEHADAMDPSRTDGPEEPCEPDHGVIWEALNDGTEGDPRQQAQDEWRVGTALKDWRPKGDHSDGEEAP